MNFPVERTSCKRLVRSLTETLMDTHVLTGFPVVPWVLKMSKTIPENEKKSKNYFQCSDEESLFVGCSRSNDNIYELFKLKLEKKKIKNVFFCVTRCPAIVLVPLSLSFSLVSHENNWACDFRNLLQPQRGTTIKKRKKDKIFRMVLFNFL